MRHPRSRLLASADRSDGSFTLTPPLLQTLARGVLADGFHALHLEATDKAGNVSRLDRSSTRPQQGQVKPLFSFSLTTHEGRLATGGHSGTPISDPPLKSDQNPLLMQPQHAERAPTNGVNS